ncbi:MAG: protein phosphatase 2C domain-containing protein [Coleofasciculaceae cyanobacterium]
MENPAAMLNCSNTRCQAPNPQSNKFCQQCRTPLLRRYLWAIGQGADSFKLPEMIDERYLVVSQRVFLETKPGMPPETPLEVPSHIVPYLRLSPYNLHIPQVYGCINPKEARSSSQIWLLEDAPLTTGSPLLGKEEAASPGQLLPELSRIWKNAAPLRQLNWLWQIAKLWEPLSHEGVASSLLNPALVRVEGSIVRLLELQPDAKAAPSLKQLGQYWSKSLEDGAAPAIAEFFQKLCNQLLDGQVKTSEQLIRVLDGILYSCGQRQQRTYQIFSATDKGPSRDHNEDACFPVAGKLVSQNSSSSEPTLAIVCDGIGGHEGGEVASNLAIEVLQEQAQHQINAQYDPITLTEQLEISVCAANDAISQQNDNERRSDRQRMGTTLVMGQTYAHEIYITHVGDSRVYLVTRQNCHQVTQDDDLASRELRLGYALYRNAVQQPASGSLVQALGMASSSTLHPTVQRFVLDEDCVFLLCSDGLSDNDRVDQFWQSEILPILDGRVDLKTAATRLIQIANTQNGHDNATVALFHCQVNYSQTTRQTQLSLEQPQTLMTPVTTIATPGAVSSAMKTQQLSSNPRSNILGLLLGIILLSGIGVVLAYLLVPGVNQLFDPLIKQVANNSNSEPIATSPSETPAATTAVSPPTVTSVVAPTIIQVSSAAANAEEKKAPLLLRRGLVSPQNQTVAGVIGAGSILEVISKSPDQQQQNWLQIRVCTAKAKALPQPTTTPSPAKPNTTKPKTAAVTYRQAVAGDGGWIKEADLLGSVDPTFSPTADQRRECSAPAAPAASPIPKPS